MDTSLLIDLIFLMPYGILATNMFSDIEVLGKYSSETLCEIG